MHYAPRNSDANKGYLLYLFTYMHNLVNVWCYRTHRLRSCSPAEEEVARSQAVGDVPMADSSADRSASN